MSNEFQLDNQLAIVTGASRGIGRGIARGLLQAGARVNLVSRDGAALENTRQELLAELSLAPEQIIAAALDVSEVERIVPWYDELQAAHGPTQILVNAAGTSRRGFAVEQPLADFEYLQRLNVTATYELSRAFARALIAAKLPGRIVNIASLMSFASRPGTAAYTASKGAVAQLTKALAIEWAPHGILVNAIAPGYISTPLTEGLVADPKFTQWVMQRCPLQRWGEPADLAGPAVFLASPASRFVTGQVLAVDGGWLANL